MICYSEIADTRWGNIVGENKREVGQPGSVMFYVFLRESEL
jgi:hypothetical protein